MLRARSLPPSLSLPPFLTNYPFSAQNTQIFASFPGLGTGPIRDSQLSLNPANITSTYPAFNFNDTLAFLTITRVRRICAWHACTIV